MRHALPTGNFKKDLKRIEKRGWKLERLQTVIVLLQRNEPLPFSARPHKLSGKWTEYWECHIESNWLLIYRFTDGHVLLARTGTHEDLF